MEALLYLKGSTTGFSGTLSCLQQVLQACLIETLSKVQSKVAFWISRIKIDC
jgi:hypothetical protein